MKNRLLAGLAVFAMFSVDARADDIFGTYQVLASECDKTLITSSEVIVRRNDQGDLQVGRFQEGSQGTYFDADLTSEFGTREIPCAQGNCYDKYNGHYTSSGFRMTHFRVDPLSGPALVEVLALTLVGWDELTISLEKFGGSPIRPVASSSCFMRKNR